MFSFVTVGPRNIGRPKTEVRFSRDGALLDRVCLSLERGFAARFNKARLGMRAWFRCLFFWWISLVRFAESRDFFAFRAGSLFCISKPLVPCLWANAGLSEYK